MSATPQRTQFFGIRVTRWRLVAMGIGVGAAYLSLATPTSLVLDDQCEPRTALARWKASVQGETFWRAQLMAVDQAINGPAWFQQISARADSMTGTYVARSQALQESVYAANPTLPRVQSSVADQLRHQANEIEMAETRAKVEQVLAAHAAAMLQCRATVVSRAGTQR